MPNQGTTKDENKHPHPVPPPSEGEGEGAGWFYLHVKFMDKFVNKKIIFTTSFLY
jgi:hypothetical protein